MDNGRLRELASNYTLEELLEGIKLKYNEIYTWVPEKYKKFDPQTSENPFFSQAEIKFDVKSLHKSHLIKMPLVNSDPNVQEKQVAKDNVIRNLTKHYLEKIENLEKMVKDLTPDLSEES